MKIIIVLILLIIISSLGSALYYLLTDRQRSPRTVHALTIRIGLSIGLFLLLILAFSMGWIKPHGLRPTLAKTPNPAESPAQPGR